MKKLSTFIIAMALIFGMAQCKKQEIPATPTDDGKWVHITLNMGDGDKHIVYPNTGAVVYTENDTIYVGNDGKFIGKLIYKSGAFSGDIYDPQTTDYLHFYFLGGLNPGKLTAGTTESFNLCISDQSAKLPVLSYGQSDKKYTNDITTYSCTLQNKCALVEFGLSEGTNGAVTVSGMHTQATVSFANTDNAIVPTNATGTITLKSETANSMWAILLPQGEVTNATVNINGKSYTPVIVPAVAANDYVQGTNAIHIENPNNHVFTVDANGNKVLFAPGNLQATFSYENNSWSWAFASNQYGFIGNAVGNTSVASSWPWITTPGTVDLFGWSTANTYFGISSVTQNSSYSGTFKNWGIEANTANLFGHNDWVTLTSEQWEYVIDKRSGKRYAKAQITGTNNGTVNGLILLPDDWNSNNLSNINVATANYTANTISASQWTTLENAGAVFLPAAGQRSGTTGVYVNGVGTEGHYWSATYKDNDYSYELTFNSGLSSKKQSFRYVGHTVRLVRFVQ